MVPDCLISPLDARTVRATTRSAGGGGSDFTLNHKLWAELSAAPSFGAEDLECDC